MRDRATEHKFMHKCVRSRNSVQGHGTAHKAVQDSARSCNSTQGKEVLHTQAWMAYQHLTLQLLSYGLTGRHLAAEQLAASFSLHCLTKPLF